jgi:hypothetical protein
MLLLLINESKANNLGIITEEMPFPTALPDTGNPVPAKGKQPDKHAPEGVTGTTTGVTACTFGLGIRMLKVSI